MDKQQNITSTDSNPINTNRIAAQRAQVARLVLALFMELAKKTNGIILS